MTAQLVDASGAQSDSSINVQTTRQRQANEIAMDHDTSGDALEDATEQQLANLIFNIKDWQITNGMLLKFGLDVDQVNSVPIGVSLRPTPFPKRLFEEAQAIQTIYNRLYAAVSEDEQWLFSVLEGQIREESLAATLWAIHEKVKFEGYIQPITLGIFRSDYMIHFTEPTAQPSPRDLQLKQVEFNTYSVAGGTHANRAAEMHEYMYRTRAYDFTLQGDAPAPTPEPLIPANNTVNSLEAGLRIAYETYGSSKTQSKVTGILFVVQPRNMNICDERPLEYALRAHDPSIPSYRVIFGQEVLAHTYLSPTKELLFQSPSLSSPVEIAVVYMRAGYDIEEYTEVGSSARLLLEKSRAIKCPSILCHLATFKKVQQELAVPRVLERFLSPKDAYIIARTFAPMYPMDEVSEAGKKGRALALNPETAYRHVLKPSLEGGGHNVYGADIPEYLVSVPEAQWHNFILMELINPVVQRSMLLTMKGLYHDEAAMEGYIRRATQHDPGADSEDLISRFGAPTVSELGIFGICLWRSKNRGAPDFLINSEAGWSLKTKPADVKEMSVVKGYGCFDSPCLVD